VLRNPVSEVHGDGCAPPLAFAAMEIASAGARITGWAHTEFGRRDDPDVEALMARVSTAALEHAGVEPDDVDAIYVGVVNGGFSRQVFEGALAARVDARLAPKPSVHVENACATGSAAIYGAMDLIEAGRGHTALVIGAEKMTALPNDRVGEVLLGSSYLKEEAALGSFAGVFAAIAGEYFDRYGDHSDELAMIAAKNHRNGVDNPWAHVRKDLGYEFCQQVTDRNPLVAGPLRRTDCSMVSDGAAAVVVQSAERARSAPRAIGFRARNQVNDHLALSDRDPTAFDGPRAAWAASLAQAGVATLDLDLVEIHDCFTIAELILYEAMGLAEPGEGARVIREGVSDPRGPLPVNRSGGLKAKGHPIGATGVSQHVMVAQQLMGEAGAMQIEDAALGGVLNMGGAAVASYASIMERVA
jgi:acetyl-CoA C-acetyltransferase